MDKYNQSLGLRLLVLLFLSYFCVSLVDSQRSLLHWRRDLELRLESYLNQRNVINEIISSSIYPSRLSANGPAVVRGGNVRFSELVIPTGGLILDSHIARPTIHVMTNKTQNYVNSKLNELQQIRDQLETIKNQMDGPQHMEYIYKGLPNSIQPQVNRSIIRGVRTFKQFMYGHMIQSSLVNLTRINYTDVNQVIRDTYMENPQFTFYDSNNRLFFEGRKTFWKTVFARDLRSGCCDRLKPLHTNRMMLKSVPQEVVAPVLIQSSNHYHEQPAIIRNLNTSQLLNRALTLNNQQGNQANLLFSQPENYIQLNNLINTRIPIQQPELLKEIIFKDVVVVEEAHLANSPQDNKLKINVLPGVQFDLSHENYLLRSYSLRNSSAIYQQVAGTTVLNLDSLFVRDLEAYTVNRLPNFRQFVTENIVRVDRPSTIRGPVQFNALPAILGPMGQSRPLHKILMMRVSGGLNVATMNGMRFPDDLIFTPGHPAARPSNVPIHIRGPKNFANLAMFMNSVRVQHLVNGLQMPAGVIPLHLNDFMVSVGTSKLIFVDGISTNHITIQSGRFDELRLREDVYDDADNLIVRSVFATQPDGTQVIRAPLRIDNLRIYGQGPDRGLLNGFKPQDIIELTGKGERLSATVLGPKTFLAPVEVTDCVFNDINNLANWTNHLIRIDRPNTVQTIHTKLAFVPIAGYMQNLSNVAFARPSNNSYVQIDRLRLDFHQPKSLSDDVNNWKFSPEFYILNRALLRNAANQTGGRYRVINRVNLMRPNGMPGRINNIALDDIVTLDAPFRFADKFVLVGKVEIAGDLRASRITSNYPIDAMDLVQFNKFRIPIMGSHAPIQLNNLVFSTNNRASFVQSRMLNGISLNEFFSSIMSLTKPQTVDTNLVFDGPVDFGGLLHTNNSLNGIPNFRQFAERLRTASYSFENGLQCNAVIIKT